MEQELQIKRGGKKKINIVYFLSGIIGILIFLIGAIHDFYIARSSWPLVRFAQKISIIDYLSSPFFLITIAVAILFILIGIKKVRKSKISNFTLCFFIFYVVVFLLKYTARFFYNGASITIISSTFLHSYLFPILIVMAIISLVAGLLSKNKSH